VDEIIFSSRDVPARQIMSLMQEVERNHLEYKIAPPESAYIIGSNAAGREGSLYLVDINALHSPANRRNKRIFDLAVCLLMLPALPVVVLLADDVRGLAANWLMVLTGRCSWVGLSRPAHNHAQKGKQSVLHPADAIRASLAGENTVSRLEVLYARDYSVYTDWRILLRAFRKLGRKAT
jgi:hypothetical protein